MLLGFMSVELQGKSWYCVAKISFGSYLFILLCFSVHLVRDFWYDILLSVEFCYIYEIEKKKKKKNDSWRGLVMTSCFCVYVSIVEIQFFGVKVDGYIF